MRNQSLLPVLLGHSLSSIQKPAFTPTPDRESFFFLEQGHVMEYVEVGNASRKIISLFFGPGEFAIGCHPVFSILESLDDEVVTQGFTYRMLIATLRKFPETSTHYRALQKVYNEKVAERIHSLQNLSWQARYEELAKKQPWVLELVKTEDIASYVGVSPALLENTYTR